MKKTFTQNRDFFVTGGTVEVDSPSYIKRPADEQLEQLVRAGEFCYILTSRQMGKSSLMVRTAQHLKQQGIRTAIIDLNSIGTHDFNAKDWYFTLVCELEYELGLSANAELWWTEHAALTPTKRFIGFLREVILKEIEGQTVIFIDEIDVTLKLTFSDDFFAGIRALYNARTQDPELNRLTFVFLGVATRLSHKKPNCLKKDSK